MAVTKPKTKKIKAFSGLVVFEMVPPTFYAEAVAAPRIEEFLAFAETRGGDGTFFAWEENVIRWPALTMGVDGLENIPGLAPLAEYLKMYADGAPVSELLEFFGNNVNKDIYNEWANVDRRRRDLGLPSPNGGGPEATEAERADPK
jgi:hypothetical protein